MQGRKCPNTSMANAEDKHLQKMVHPSLNKCQNKLPIPLHVVHGEPLTKLDLHA